MAAEITAEEFERRYAEGSGMSVEQLRAIPLVVRPCDCGEEGCLGWQMATPERAADIDDPDQPWVR
jgi:hypothetical protein